jgi:hypothetical protein
MSLQRNALRQLVALLKDAKRLELRHELEDRPLVPTLEGVLRQVIG